LRHSDRDQRASAGRPGNSAQEEVAAKKACYAATPLSQLLTLDLRLSYWQRLLRRFGWQKNQACNLALSGCIDNFFSFGGSLSSFLG